MSHVLQISDDKYDVAAKLAAARGQTLEELINSLLDDAWEHECTPYDAAFHADPDWIDSARGTQGGVGTTYSSTEAFFSHLGADDEQLQAARRLDQDDWLRIGTHDIFRPS